MRQPGSSRSPILPSPLEASTGVCQSCPGTLELQAPGFLCCLRLSLLEERESSYAVTKKESWYEISLWRPPPPPPATALAEKKRWTGQILDHHSQGGPRKHIRPHWSRSSSLEPRLEWCRCPVKWLKTAGAWSGTPWRTTRPRWTPQARWSSTMASSNMLYSFLANPPSGNSIWISVRT